LAGGESERDKSFMAGAYRSAGHLPILENAH
jgi:hypothetical protein